MKPTLLFLLLGILISGQQDYPSGVISPIIWVKDKGENVINTNKSLNFNDKNFPLQWELTQDQAQRCSLFIVYKGYKNNEEQILWNLAKGNQQMIVATNERLTDYTSSKHQTYFQKNNGEKVKIHYYQHFKNLNDKDNSQNKGGPGPQKKIILSLGDKIVNFPPKSFEGEISEILFYDRVLSPIEMQQVSSYLAIKYGVSLRQLQFKNYYNSQKEIIWDYDAHKEFNQNITAIGEDKDGALKQTASQNSNDEGLLAMGFTPQSIQSVPNNYFVFWSDNGKELSFKKQKEGQPKGISRVWQLDYTRKDSVSLFSRFDLAKLTPSEGSEKNNEQQDTPRKLYHWLVIDTSGENKFSPQNSKYIKIAEADQPKIINYKGWAELGASKVNFTFWEAPSMFSHLDIQNGKCSEASSGKVAFNIIGGRPPYKIQIQNLDSNRPEGEFTMLDDKDTRPIDLPSGKYSYSIVDALQQKYSQEFYLVDNDAPAAGISKEYIIKNPIQLTPQKTLPAGHYTFEWYKDGQLVSGNSTYVLNQPGDYELRVTSQEGCQSISKFKATSSPIEIEDSKFLLYPNPSTDGNFKVLATFPKSTSGSIEIYTMDGRLIKTKEFYNEEQVEYSGYLPLSGVYIITIKSTLGAESKKLIIH